MLVASAIAELETLSLTGKLDVSDNTVTDALIKLALPLILFLLSMSRLSCLLADCSSNLHI